jgi:arsenite oxidase large subunit
MHLAINSGTDLALFNAWLTYIADNGWTDKAFIAASTKEFDKALAANKTSLDEAAQITGLTVARMDRTAEARWRTPTNDVRLRKGPDLG